MMALYLADVVSNMRWLSGVVLGVCALFGFFGGLGLVDDDLGVETKAMRRVLGIGLWIALGLSVASLLTLALTPTVATMRQMGGLVPMREHEGKHGDDCSHIIWRPANSAEAND